MFDTTHIVNMTQLLDALEVQAADRVFLKYMEGREVREVTAPRFFQMARQYAAVLAREGLQGAHIGVMGANRVEWLAKKTMS